MTCCKLGLCLSWQTFEPNQLVLKRKSFCFSTHTRQNQPVLCLLMGFWFMQSQAEFEDVKSLVGHDYKTYCSLWINESWPTVVMNYWYWNPDCFAAWHTLHSPTIQVYIHFEKYSPHQFEIARHWVTCAWTQPPHHIFQGAWGTLPCSISATKCAGWRVVEHDLVIRYTHECSKEVPTMHGVHVPRILKIDRHVTHELTRQWHCHESETFMSLLLQQGTWVLQLQSSFNSSWLSLWCDCCQHEFNSQQRTQQNKDWPGKYSKHLYQPSFVVLQPSELEVSLSSLIRSQTWSLSSISSVLAMRTSMLLRW